MGAQGHAAAWGGARPQRRCGWGRGRQAPSSRRRRRRAGRRGVAWRNLLVRGRPNTPALLYGVPGPDRWSPTGYRTAARSAGIFHGTLESTPSAAATPGPSPVACDIGPFHVWGRHAPGARAGGKRPTCQLFFFSAGRRAKYGRTMHALYAKAVVCRGMETRTWRAGSSRSGRSVLPPEVYRVA